MECYPELLRRNPDLIGKHAVGFAKAFGLDGRSAARVICACPVLLLADPKNLAAKARAAAKVFGLPLKRYLGLARKCPNILNLTPETAKLKIEAFGKHFGLARSETIAFLTKHPQLLSRSVSAIIGNSEKLAELLGLPASRLVKSGGSIFCMSPARIKGFAREFGAVFGIPEATALDLVRFRPKLLTSNIATLRNNVEGIASSFEADRDQVLGRVLTQPTLFAMRPDRIRVHIETIGRAAGIAGEEVFQICLKSPSLFCRKTAGVLRKLEMLQSIAALFDRDVTAAEFLQKHHRDLCYSEARLKDRHRLGSLHRSAFPSWVALVESPDCHIAQYLAGSRRPGRRKQGC